MEHVWDEEVEIALCKVCGLVEGSLTTDCCGERVPMDMVDKIYGGVYDYRKGFGWVRDLNPTNQSWLEGKIFDLVSGNALARGQKPLSKNEIILKYGIDKKRYAEIEREMIKYLYERVEE